MRCEEIDVRESWFVVVKAENGEELVLGGILAGWRDGKAMLALPTEAQTAYPRQLDTVTVPAARGEEEIEVVLVQVPKRALLESRPGDGRLSYVRFPSAPLARPSLEGLWDLLDAKPEKSSLRASSGAVDEKNWEPFIVPAS